ncbi:vesicle-associated membrane protein-associated protein B isoform X2 [Neocloeon triangulifer]|uniref:vesicle-associated membrane protein-associated protein B isoform X2 n=1 Tax=Neocloeon triangulifer TaxID=2078957 RepID=UPI00286F2BD7|nr:vesicle-associated membrane protein-associated protein B isoform X2 [Neocloeon triangulifer]
MFKGDKPEQVLQIEPSNELRFTGPFTSAVTSYINLKNPSDKKVCYKIKTTAPKQYCVRPNSGTLDPVSSVEIAVSLQPQQGEFPGTENYKHKFMVQTMFAPDGEYDADQLWKEITPEKLMDSKLKCVFSSGSEVPATEDCVKEAPVQEKKVTKSNKAENELARAAAEVKTLREEESTLRQENLALKEEVLRLRKSNREAREHSGDSSIGSGGANAQTLATMENNRVYLVLGIFAVLFGILLGKFLL